MEYTNLGRSGLKVSRICLGCMTYGDPNWRDWVLSEAESRPFIKKALDAGINFFDTADMYSKGKSEEVLGRALKDYANRDEVVIATKVYYPMGNMPNRQGLSRKHIMEAVDASLRRLGTDYIDLYQIHRWDKETPIEETMEALNDVVKSGKVRYLGASSMCAWQFAKAQYTAKLHSWHPFISMQNHYNLVFREEEREMAPLCLDLGVGLIPWSPLARGFLAGTRTKDKGGASKRSKSDHIAHAMYYQKNDFEVLACLMKVAKKKKKAPAQVALAWLLSRPGLAAPIIGASKMAHLEDALESLKIKLSDEECKILENSYEPHPLLTFGMDPVHNKHK